MGRGKQRAAGLRSRHLLVCGYRIGHDGHRRILLGNEFQRGARGTPGYHEQFYGDAVTVETVRQRLLFRLFDETCPDGFMRSRNFVVLSS